MDFSPIERASSISLASEAAFEESAPEERTHRRTAKVGPAEVNISIPYGDRLVSFSVPRENLEEIVEPNEVRFPPSELRCIESAIDHPIGTGRLEEIVHRGQKIVVVGDDLTRVTPLHKVLPSVVGRLNGCGIGDDDITVVIALGTHRPMTEEELSEKVGPSMYSRLRVVNHDYRCKDRLTDLGTSDLGIRVWINKSVAEADVKIGIGNIIPHASAGWSGGAKILYPGVAGEQTVEEFHAGMAYDMRNKLGAEIAPLREDIEKLVQKIGLDFIINTVCDSYGRIYRVVAGDYIKAHRKGIQHARALYGVKVKAKADVVVISSYPKNIEFWQGGVGLYAAKEVVKEGGTIILVTPCPEGIARMHPLFAEYIAEDPDTLLEKMKANRVEDKTAAAPAVCVARVKQQADVGVYTELHRNVVEGMGFGYVVDMDQAIGEALARYGKNAKAMVISHGGDSLPYL